MKKNGKQLPAFPLKAMTGMEPLPWPLNHVNKTQGQVNYTMSVKNTFWPLCTQENVNHSSHGCEHIVGVCGSDINKNKNVSGLVNEKNKCQLPLARDTRASQNKVDKQGTVSAPQNETSDIVNQTDQVNDNVSDPNKYALDLRLPPRHRFRIQKVKNCRIFKLWDEQMSDKFGYIPLQDQTIPSHDHRNASMADVLKMHETISNWDTYNFLDCQIQVPSELNADV